MPPSSQACSGHVCMHVACLCCNLLSKLPPPELFPKKDAPQLITAPAMCSLDDPMPEQVARGGGAHKFFGQQGRLLVASPRDPLHYNIHRWKHGRDSGLRVGTPKGHMDLTLARSAPSWLSLLSCLPQEVAPQAALCVPNLLKTFSLCIASRWLCHDATSTLRLLLLTIAGIWNYCMPPSSTLLACCQMRFGAAPATAAQHSRWTSPCSG